MASKLKLCQTTVLPLTNPPFTRSNHSETFAQVSEDGGVWTIKTSTTLKTMELKFKVNQFVPFTQQIKLNISIL